MKNIVLGVLLREIITKDGYKGNYLNSALYQALKRPKVQIIGIPSDSNEDIFGLCDGFVLPGGDFVDPTAIKIISYAKKECLPVLGVCQGMQELAVAFGGESLLSELKDPSQKKHFVPEQDLNLGVHQVAITPNTMLFDLFGNSLAVNSRHRQYVIKCPISFEVSAISNEDVIIEGIEKINADDYFVGVQWHPEDMPGMEALFDDFIKRARKQ